MIVLWSLIAVDVYFILPVYAYYLRAAKVFSPLSRQYVLGETALANLLKSQLSNERMINRFFHIFAREDGFGMLFGEFLMV